MTATLPQAQLKEESYRATLRKRRIFKHSTELLSLRSILSQRRLGVQAALRWFFMTKTFPRVSRKIGLPPGSLVHIGKRKVEKVRITVMHYNGDDLEEKQVEKIEDCLPIRDAPGITWLNIDGLNQVDIVEKIGKDLGLHPLTMEDILNTEERPKLEDLDEYIFIVTKMLYFSKTETQMTSEQVSIIVGSDCVVTFQEKMGDVFDAVRERIRNGKGRIRKMGADYLAFALLDAIVDNYFVILEKIGDRMELMEEAVVDVATRETLYQIHDLRRELLFVRKVVWPLREVISCLERSESRLVEQSTRVYLSDVYDHVIQVIDNVEVFREMFSSMLEVYVTSISNRMNEIMKVLTIIATIFIPLTFIAGVYGMNFHLQFPPLEWEGGFLAVMFLDLAVAVTMLGYFKKKKWL
jgi:magnesium transporter